MAASAEEPSVHSSHRHRDHLAHYFEAEEVRWKPQAVKGARALAIAYVNARAVMDRLDDVLGVGGWQDAYTGHPDGSVSCRLSCRLGEEWVTKEDVGGESEQPDGGDRRKAAYSDALKRVAVKFGVGRYLYRLPQQWAEYDPARRCFAQAPALPDWAVAATAAQVRQLDERAVSLSKTPAKIAEHYGVSALRWLSLAQWKDATALLDRVAAPRATA